jgi:hypothetical protein
MGHPYYTNMVPEHRHIILLAPGNAILEVIYIL